MLEEVEYETNWIGADNGTDNHNSDILVAFTGQDPYLISELYNTSMGISHPASASCINRIPPPSTHESLKSGYLVQHEISHLFGTDNHYDGGECIMDKTLGSAIFTTHEWDNKCFNIIESNKSEVSLFMERNDYDITK